MHKPGVLYLKNAYVHLGGGGYTRPSHCCFTPFGITWHHIFGGRVIITFLPTSHPPCPQRSYNHNVSALLQLAPSDHYAVQITRIAGFGELLFVGGGDIYGNQLLQFLQHMWSLVKLDIGNLECLDNHLFDALHYCGTYSQHLVPKLTTLLLTAILDSINENRIASMIKSWWWTDDELHTVSHFERVSIDLWGWALDVSMEKWLEHCHQEGLVWTLSWIVKPWIIYSSYVHISNTDIGGGGSSDIIAGGWSLVLLFNLMSLYF